MSHLSVERTLYFEIGKNTSPMGASDLSFPHYWRSVKLSFMIIWKQNVHRHVRYKHLSETQNNSHVSIRLFVQHIKIWSLETPIHVHHNNTEDLVDLLP